MRSAILKLALAGSIIAAPQDIDFDAVDEAPDPTSVPLYVPDVTKVVIPYTQSAALSSIQAEVSADPLPQASGQSNTLLAKRDLPCNPPAYGVDGTSEDSFYNSPVIADKSANTAKPSKYNVTFSGLTGASNAYGYMGFDTLSTYDVNYCASQCDKKAGCLSFNIYFERDPVNTTTCTTYNEQIVIKCSYWGSAIDKTTAVNDGQWRTLDNGTPFHVLVAGSNGYVSTNFKTIPGYTQAYLGTAAINAPLDCNGVDTYMGVKIITGKPFDTELCSELCSAQTKYNVAHPPKTGDPRICRFFNTYIISKNGVPQGQYCAMYTEAWDTSYATNKGQWRGKDEYTISYSFSNFNTTDPGCPFCPGDIAWAQQDASAQAFCTSFLGYSPTTAAATTTVAPATSTVVVSTVVTITEAPSALDKRETKPTPEGYMAGVGELKARALDTPVRMQVWCTSHLSIACSQVATGAVTSTATVSGSVTPLVTSTSTSTVIVASA